MKQLLLFIKENRNWFLLALIISSLILIAFDWIQLREFSRYLSGITEIGIGLLITEAFFVIGVILMAISAGENLSEYKRFRHWPRGFSELRRNARFFAEHLIVSRIFTVGFWLNFIGAVGTSIILIVGIITFAPITGIGLLIIILIDLMATFGWRVPLELARRRIHKHGSN